jgi:hypothetical protein
VNIFCQTKHILAGHSLATVKKMDEVWRKTDLFGVEVADKTGFDK